MSAKVVMISGANRGIGLEVARHLQRDGWSVSLGSRSGATPLGEGDDRLAVAYDALEDASAPRWVEATLARFGRLDALVNVAGVLHPLAFDGTDGDANDDRLREMIAVNCVGPWRLSRLAFPSLRAARGRIVNVVSVSGKKATSPEEAGYCVSKFAAMGVSEVARAAGVPHGVGVTAVCPGWVDTDMTRGLGLGLIAERAGILAAAEVAAAVAYVLSLPSHVDLPELVLNDTMKMEAP